jgi:hypothetical protein
MINPRQISQGLLNAIGTEGQKKKKKKPKDCWITRDAF